jgi:hypothetical protein
MRRVILFLALFVSLSSATGASAQRTSATTSWAFVHFHINAYAHWGHCYSPSNFNDQPSWRHYAVTCTASAELGQIERLVILNHSSKASFHWVWPDLWVSGDQRSGLDGKFWSFHGIVPNDFHWYEVDKAMLAGHAYVSGTDKSKRGQPGGPLAVNLSSHTYNEPLKAGLVGFSLNLQGYVRLK